MAFFYLTTPRAPVGKAHRMTLIGEAKFTDPFKTARSSIVQRVSMARVI